MQLFAGGFTSAVLVCLLLVLGQNGARVRALDLDLSSAASIKSAASTLAYNMLTYYTGNRTGDVPGQLPAPYYWWEAGAMWMTLIEYWHYTGDTTYNDVVSQAMQFQVGANKDYLPANQSKDEGNDDQVFWAFAAMDAAELKFPDPPADKPQWLELAQAVFNQQAGRWDSQNCGGGLRWQIYSFNSGYDYKNTISNGGFFQLAARLARYTGNSTYAEWANKMYDWMMDSPLLKQQGNSIMVYDGTAIAGNCSDADQLAWTYNYGTMISGATYMYNYTNGSAVWESRLASFLNATNMFFPSSSGGNIMSEIECEPKQNCDLDQPSFKAYLSRWMAVTTQLAPTFHDQIMVKINASAAAAAKQCSGPTVATNGGNTIAGTTCGRRWYQATYDGESGVGESMSALSIIGSTLIDSVAAPVSVNTGGTSKGNPSAGSTNPNPSGIVEKPITTADRAGAAIITIILLVCTVGGAVWLSM